MWVIKHKPEDFRVDEIHELPLTSGGPYSYYKLEKYSYTTMAAVKLIARNLNVKEQHINFAGTKDKIAVTTQYLSLRGGPHRDFSWKDIVLTFEGTGKERLNLGCHQGNKFTIVARNITSETFPESVHTVPNYFGEQRFGKDKTTAVIGEHLIRKQFKEACELIDPECTEAPLQQLRKIPKRMLKMYLHAYSSKLWNQAVSEYLGQFPCGTDDGLNYPKDSALELPLKTAPVVGFCSELDSSNPIHLILERLLEENDLTLRDFIIRELPDCSPEGVERDILIPINDYSITPLEDDDCFEGTKKRTFSFSLQKGSYATIVLSSLRAMAQDLNN